VIGGGDWAKDRLMPDIVRSLSKNEKIQIRNPKAVRPWQHVLDPLWGYLTLVMNMSQNPIQFADSFNFGPYPNDVLSVKEMTELSINIWGSGEVEFPELQNQPHEAGLLSLDITKAEKVLDWTPKLNAKTALEFTLEWYKSYYDKKNNMMTVLEKQIETFLQK
jgi:CDP-glucose 4,6-dehydratase